MSEKVILTPPPGETVDYYHSESLGHQVTDTNWVSISLAAALVLARLVVRFGITHNAGSDDCEFALLLE